MEQKTSWLKIERFRWLPVIAALLASCFTSPEMFAQDDAAAEDAAKKEPDVEMLECNVKVLDPDGFPIEDAVVYCTGLRSKEEPGSHWGWTEERFGPKPRIRTDADGIATMPYPKMLTEEFTTGTMTWSVEHPSFVNYREDHSVDDDPAEVALERGFRIALTAVDASTGEKIKEKLHAVASFAGGGKWELKKNGMLVSSVMKKQDGFLRVVSFREGEPTLFSDEIEVKPGDKSRVLFKEIQLSIGSRVEGSLDESIPRPIKNGYVIACIYKAHPVDRRSRWRWADEAEIAEDGTFVFESLPADEAVQMIPICDGWVPAKPSVADVLAVMPSAGDPKQLENSIKNFSACPQLIKTESDKNTASLAMVKAASVTVKVVDQNDQPLANIKTGTNPNQFWFKAGSQILGSSYPTRLAWEMTDRGKELNSFYESRRSRYYSSTDKDGVFVLMNMPPGNYGIVAYQEGMEMPKDPISGDQEKRVLVQNKDLNVTIKLYPKGSLPKGGQPLSETLTNWWNQMTEKTK